MVSDLPMVRWMLAREKGLSMGPAGATGGTGCIRCRCCGAAWLGLSPLSVRR